MVAMNGEGTSSLALPNDPTLIGFTFHAQGYAVNSASHYFTRGATVVIGAR